jgi:hypothetical protein
LQKEILASFPHIKINVCARAYRNTPLTDEDNMEYEIEKAKFFIDNGADGIFFVMI